MTWNDFIFSRKATHRISRHLALWACFCCYFFIVNFTPSSINDFQHTKPYHDALQKMIYLPVSFFSVYVSIYFLLPRYVLKEKYFAFFVSVLCLSLIDMVFAWQLTKLLVLLTQKVSFYQLPMQFRIFQPVIYSLGLGLAASGFAVIIKVIKTSYLKEKENESLRRQKINTELQTIKTKFHPHFLSEALKNIARLIRHHSVDSPAVILKLADLLSYILYESDENFISLEKELAMVQDYLDLEKKFYGDKINIRFEQRGKAEGKTIAPLILLSLVQNCCEHSLISLRQSLSIHLQTVTEEQKLDFLLRCNGHYHEDKGPGYNTGLEQALQRVEMIYPGRCRLNTKSSGNYLVIEMQLETGNLVTNKVLMKNASLS